MKTKCERHDGRNYVTPDRVYYFVRLKGTTLFRCGVGKNVVPKLYKLGGAHQVCQPNEEICVVTSMGINPIVDYETEKKARQY